MYWLTKMMWIIAIGLAGLVLFLLFIQCIPFSIARAASQATMQETSTIQVMPTDDATVTALNKEKLAQEVQQLKEQNAPDPFAWLRTNASILLSTLVVVIGGLIGLFRWFGDRQSEREKRREDQRNEREKRAEERFQSAVTSLGDDKEGAKIGAAILLRTFLRPGYEQFYTQTFDLAIANLRLPRTSHVLEDDPDALHSSSQGDRITPLPLTTLSQALITVFKEAFPLVRQSSDSSGNDGQALPSLDATGVQLDRAYLRHADLQQAWMPQAFLRLTNLSLANLSKANLSRADLSNADLSNANFSFANLSNANLSFANLTDANLTDANLTDANLIGANLTGAVLVRASLRETNLSFANFRDANLRNAFCSNANLSGADLRKANLTDVHFGGANLTDANLCRADLHKADLNVAKSFQNTKLCGVQGVSQQELEYYKNRGANIDVDEEQDIMSKLGQLILTLHQSVNSRDTPTPVVPPVSTTSVPAIHDERTGSADLLHPEDHISSPTDEHTEIPFDQSSEAREQS